MESTTNMIPCQGCTVSVASSDSDTDRHKFSSCSIQSEWKELLRNLSLARHRENLVRCLALSNVHGPTLNAS